MRTYALDRSYLLHIETHLIPDAYQSVAQIEVCRDGLPILVSKQSVGLIGGEATPYTVSPDWIKENKGLVFDVTVTTHVLKTNDIQEEMAVFQVEVIHQGLEFRLQPPADISVFNSVAHVPCRVDPGGQLVVSIYPLMRIKDEPLDPKQFPI